MKYSLTLLCGVLFSLSAFAQPSNNECVNLIDLGTAPVCTDDIYTNVDATSSSTSPDDVPLCFNGGVVSNDVYFGFQVDASLVDVTITISGTDMGPNGIPWENPQFALYRGDCNGLAELDCAIGSIGDNVISIDAIGLTPGLTYFLRVDSYSDTGTPVWGDFTVCIEEFIPAFNMGDGTFTSSCSGTIFDSGGPDEDYGDGEEFVFTICPQDFTQCIELDVMSFNIFSGDQLNVYEGASTAGTQIAALVGNSNGNEFIIESSNSCITLQFISDGFNSSAGFEAAWQCSPLECDGSDIDSPTVIDAIPFNNTNLTTCGEGANFNQTPCGTLPFLNGPETVFIYDSPGGICAEIDVTGAEPGTGVIVLNGPPDDPGTLCVAQSGTGSLNSVNFQTAGEYYIVVANGEGCTDFGLNIVEDECSISPTLVNALCNPLNGCIEDGELTSQLIFEDGSEDILGLDDAGCWVNNGFQTDYLWFTIQAQADGPFGFIMSGTTIDSDIDINVWGPFTQDDVCETPNAVIETITTTDPIRSTWTGGNQPTGLADIHPVTGIDVTDDYDCGSLDTPGAGGDRIVRTIPAMEGEVYVILANDWGDQISDGAISIDWSPSNPEVLQPLESTVAAADTSVCAGESVQLEVLTGLDNIRWIGDNADQLSCNACFDPIATPPIETEVYTAVLNAPCYQDTINVTVNVFDLDAGPDVEICVGEEFEIPAGPDFDQATYEWSPPPGLQFSCTDCGTPVISAEAPGVYEVPVTLTAAACAFMDMLTVTVLDFSAPDFDVIDDERICAGEEIQIGGEPDASNTYVWTSVPTSDVDQVANPMVQPNETTTYFVSVTNGVCPLASVDSVTIEVTQLPLIEIAETPDPVCQGDAISLSSVTVEDDVIYSWNGPQEIQNPDSSFTTIIPVASGNYTLTGDRLGCEVEDVQFVEVIPIFIDLNQPDTLFRCNTDEPFQVEPTIVPTSAMIEWMPDDIMVNNPILDPQTYTVYTATVTVGNCVRVDSFAVQVDSLPVDMSIMADPFKDPYCQGELVTLVSPIYEPADYPDIMHDWFAVIGDQTSDTLYNMVITTQDTFTYQRLTINGGCEVTDTIRLNVVTNEALNITPIQPEICPGDSVQLTLAGPGQLGDIEWTPETGLSCTDCPDPVARPTSTTTYMVSSAIEGCAIMQSVTVSVLEEPSVAVVTESICPGDEIALAVGVPQAGTTYAWSADNDPDFNSAEFNPLVMPSTTTTYSVTASNVCGSDTSEGTITVVQDGALISVNEGIDTIVTCRGFEFDLVANVLESANGDNTLNWTYDGGGQSGTEATFTATQSGSAVFTFSYGTTTGVTCNQFTGEVFIQVNDAPQDVQLIGDDESCFSDLQTFILNNGTGEPGVTYSWTGTDGFTSMEPDPEVTPSVTTTYTLEASLGECTVVDSVTITVIQPATLTGGDPVVAILDDNGNLQEDLEITATVDGADPNGVRWTFLGDSIGVGVPLIWEPGDSQLDSLPNFVFATLDTGCEILVDSVLVQKLDIRVPDLFSPNNDGMNDVFKPFFLGTFDVVEVKVYNRWGQVVFESNDNTNPGWDGMKDDKEAPSDAYLWSIRVGIGSAIIEQQGQVTLVR
ncbi:MAG: gliding motility-associated C-terminal domain-containing protein [Bacteroidota bacterium]